MSEKSGQKMIRRIAAGLILLMGLALIQDRAQLLLEGHNSVSWPSVEGTVGEASALPLAGMQLGPGWRIRVVYEYQVEGRYFTGNRLRFSRRLGAKTKAQAEQALVSYVPGGPIQVYYDPAEPARAVILPGSDRRAWFGFIVGLALTAIAVIFWTVPTRRQSSPNTRRRDR